MGLSYKALCRQSHQRTTASSARRVVCVKEQTRQGRGRAALYARPAVWCPRRAAAPQPIPALLLPELHACPAADSAGFRAQTSRAGGALSYATAGPSKLRTSEHENCAYETLHHAVQTRSTAHQTVARAVTRAGVPATTAAPAAAAALQARLPAAETGPARSPARWWTVLLPLCCRGPIARPQAE